MTWEQAQAGNRASQTVRYLQWWENRSEWDAVTSAMDKWHNSTLIIIIGHCFRTPCCTLSVHAPGFLEALGMGYFLFDFLNNPNPSCNPPLNATAVRHFREVLGESRGEEKW